MLPAPGKLDKATRRLDFSGRNLRSVHLESEKGALCYLSSSKQTNEAVNCHFKHKNQLPAHAYRRGWIARTSEWGVVWLHVFFLRKHERAFAPSWLSCDVESGLMTGSLANSTTKSSTLKKKVPIAAINMVTSKDRTCFMDVLQYQM